MWFLAMRESSPIGRVVGADGTQSMSSSRCIVCESEKKEPVFRTRDRHYGITGEFSVVCCTGCGLMQMDPMPTAEELASFYDQDYYAYQPLPSSGGKSSLKGRLRNWLAPEIVTNNPKGLAPGEFLDIGCGSGDYLHVMKSMGWRVRGVEPSSFGASEGRRAGLDIFHGNLREANFSPNTFDYVRANHSFEHMPDPVEVLDEIYRIVKPGGKVFIGVPNAESLPYRLFGKYWFHLTVPLHVYCYGTSNLSTLLRKRGFVIEDVHFNSNYMSLLGSLQIFANRNNGKPSTDGRLVHSRALTAFAAIIERGADMAGRGDAIEVIVEKPR